MRRAPRRPGYQGGALGDCTWSGSKALGCSFCEEAGDMPQISLGKRSWRAVEKVSDPGRSFMPPVTVEPAST